MTWTAGSAGAGLRAGLGHVECLPLGAAQILHNRESGALVASDAFGATVIDQFAQTGEVAATIRGTATVLGVAEDRVAAPVRDLLDGWYGDGLFLEAMRPFPGAIAHRSASVAREVRFELGPRAVVLRSECTDLAEDIVRAMAPMGLEAAAVSAAPGETVGLDALVADDGLAVFRDGAPVWGVSGYELARFHLLREIMDVLCGPQQIAAHLHASAVEKDGVALVFAGASGSGKSTLATLLVGAGARLAADDHVAVGVDGETLGAFPTRSNLKPGSYDLPEVRAVTGLAHGAEAGVETLERPVERVPAGRFSRLGAFVFPHYAGPGSENSLTPIAKPEALQLLIQTGSRVSRTTRSVAPLIHALNTRPSYRLSFGDTEFAVSTCLNLF